MRLFNLILLLLVLSTCLAAQSARVNKGWLVKQDSSTLDLVIKEGWLSSDLDRGVSVHVMPLGLINVLPRFRIGMQFKPNRFSYLLDVEYGTGSGTPLYNYPGFNNYSFIGIRPEVRFDLDVFRPGWYVGLEASASFVKRDVQGMLWPLGSDVIQLDFARQERTRSSVTGKVGLQVLAGKHILFDFYTGLGIAVEEYTYSGRVNARRITVNRERPLRIEEIKQDFGLYGLMDVGRRLRLEVAFGVRVGWWF